MGMISSLCGIPFRRRPQPPSKDEEQKDSATFKPKIMETKTAAAAATEVASTPRADDEVESDDAKVEAPPGGELPLPPARMHLNGSHSCNRLPRAASSRPNLKTNSIVKIPRSLSATKLGRDGKKEKLKREDSIWTKTIILGEKCRVPDDDEDAVIYDNKGNRISAYRTTRTPRSLTISRTNSMIDQDAIPS